jgi:hypothetical protein
MIVAGQPPEPLVSIGIPTYERADTLQRTLASALAQTHGRLEVVISDNASRDGTEELCRTMAARDPRVRYLRQERNRGPTENFNALFAACDGNYVMMLADDDWIDPGYVAKCLAELRRDGTAALVAGWPRYVRDGVFIHDGIWHEHRHSDPAARVVAYLRAVDDNGVFYGLVPREVLQRARPLPNVLGNDWLHLARIACQGSIRMLPEVRIHRELGGTSADVSTILATFGRSGWQARVPQLIIAGVLAADIGWRHPVYRLLGPRRWILAVRGAAASMRWRALAWHLITPTVAGVARRPRSRFVYRLYSGITRALGAGQRR